MSENITMPAEEEIYYLSEFYKVFGDSTRIKVLYLLVNRELCVNDIAQRACYDPKLHFSPATCLKAAPSGKIPPGRQDCLLFSG